MRKNKTTWRDLIARVFKLETGSKAGNINMWSCGLILIFFGIILIPSTAEIISRTILTFSGKPTGGVSPEVMTLLLITGFFYLVACPTVLMYIENKRDQ